MPPRTGFASKAAKKATPPNHPRPFTTSGGAGGVDGRHLRDFIRDRRDAVRRANEDLRNVDADDSFASSAKSTAPWRELKANAAADLGAILGELAPPADLLDFPEEPTEASVASAAGAKANDRRRAVDGGGAGTSRSERVYDGDGARANGAQKMDDLTSFSPGEGERKLTSFSPGEGKTTADPLWMRAAFHRERSEEFTPLTGHPPSKGSTPRRVLHGFPKSVTPPAPPPEECEFTHALPSNLRAKELSESERDPRRESESESESETESDDESPSWVVRATACDTPIEPAEPSVRDSLETGSAPAAENSRPSGPSPRIWAEGDDVSDSEHEVDASETEMGDAMCAGGDERERGIGSGTNLFRDSLAGMDSIPGGQGVASSVAEIASSVEKALNSMETFQRIEQKVMGESQPVSRPSRKFGDGIVSGRRISPAKLARESGEGEDGEATSPTSPLPQVSTRRASPLEMERERRRERERAERDEKERREAEETEARLERELAELPTRKTTVDDLDESTDDARYDDVDEDEAAAAADAIPDDMPPPRAHTPEPDEDEEPEDAYHRTPSAAAGYHPWHHAPATDPYHHQQVYRAAARKHHAAVGSGYGVAADVKQARLARVASAPAGARRPSPSEKVFKVAEKPLKCQGSYVAAAEEAEARKRRESARRAALEAEAEAARREAAQAQMGRRAQSADTQYVPVFQPPGGSPQYHIHPGYHSPPGYDAYGQQQQQQHVQQQHVQQYTDPHMQWHPDPRQYQQQAAAQMHPAHHPRPHHHHQQQHWQQYPPQPLHHLHHTAITPQPQPATTPRKEGPKRVTPQGRRAPSGSGRRYAETAPPKPRVKFADTKEGRAVRELLGKSSAGAGGERYVNRVKSSTGSPTSLSLEEAKLLASLKRLDAHCLAVPVDNMRGSALDNGYHDSPYVDPGMGGRRSVEEAALMASLARLDTQLGGLGPPEREMREIEERNARVGRDVSVARRHRVMPHAAPPAVFGTPPTVHYGVSHLNPPPVPQYEPSPVGAGGAGNANRRRFEYQPPPLPPPTRRWRPPNREAGDVVKDHWGAPPPKVESARRGRVRTAVGFTLPKVQTRHQEHSQGRIHGGRVSDYFY